MNKEKIKSLTKDLLNASSLCAELKEAANKWLNADSAEETKIFEEYVKILKESIIPVDGLIAFCGSDEAKKKFGEETAKKFLEHGKELKEKGAKYCDCPACSIVEKILLEL